ncbi:hepcidin isoform X6 [Strigops habroptila]|uniref:hepcidin isoform X6 n=1 Tax=Strigops habroptila TaxID=2489341 RepID=UPI0011CF5BBD|nr:hepcidin isoform X6 [Strigops habroptila]XP_030330703.1 hepcidin isoform X6 [Strigops habroptila]
MKATGVILLLLFLMDSNGNGAVLQYGSMLMGPPRSQWGDPQSQWGAPFNQDGTPRNEGDTPQSQWGHGQPPQIRRRRHSSHFPLCSYCCNCCRNRGCGFCCRT